MELPTASSRNRIYNSFASGRKAKKGRRSMHPSPNLASTSLADSNPRSQPTRRPEDLLYQAVTLAAILLVLGSVWIF